MVSFVWVVSRGPVAQLIITFSVLAKETFFGVAELVMVGLQAVDGGEPRRGQRGRRFIVAVRTRYGHGHW